MWEKWPGTGFGRGSARSASEELAQIDPRAGLGQFSLRNGSSAYRAISVAAFRADAPDGHSAHPRTAKRA